MSFKGLPIEEAQDFFYDLEDEIENISRTFSLNNKKQESNLIEALKINCRKIVKEKNQIKSLFKLFSLCMDILVEMKLAYKETPKVKI